MAENEHRVALEKPKPTPSAASTSSSPSAMSLPLSLSQIDPRQGGSQFLLDLQRERTRKTAALEQHRLQLQRLLDGYVDLGDPALGAGGDGQTHPIILGSMEEDDGILSQLLRNPYIKMAVGDKAKIETSLKPTPPVASSTSTSAGFNRPSSEGAAMSQVAAGNNNGGNPSSNNSLAVVLANSDSVAQPNAQVQLEPVSGGSGSSSEIYYEGYGTSAERPITILSFITKRWDWLARLVYGRLILALIAGLVLVILGFCLVFLLVVNSGLLSKASQAQSQAVGNGTVTKATAPGINAITTTVATGIDGNGNGSGSGSNRAATATLVSTIQPQQAYTAIPNTPVVAPTFTANPANSNSSNNTLAAGSTTSAPVIGAATGTNSSNNPNSGDPNGLLQHQGFLAPSQIVAAGLNFSSQSIVKARRDDATGSPVAAPPKGVLYQWGSFPGEAPGNVVLVGDYQTIGVPLVELLQQNDEVTIIDRKGDSYTYRIMNYTRLTNLMRGGGGGGNSMETASATSTVAAVSPITTTTTTDSSSIVPTTSQIGNVAATATALATNFDSFEVLYDTRYDDLSLLEMPVNTSMSVLTLVSMARPAPVSTNNSSTPGGNGSNINQVQRLAVRGLLVSYKPAKQTGPAGTPVGIDTSGNAILPTTNTASTAITNNATPKPTSNPTLANGSSNNDTVAPSSPNPGFGGTNGTISDDTGPAVPGINDTPVVTLGPSPTPLPLTTPSNQTTTTSPPAQARPKGGGGT